MITRADLSLAEECAKGVRQLALVRELAVGPIEIRTVPGLRGFHWHVYGTCRASYSSWTGLRNRLGDAGFQIEILYPTPVKNGTVEVWR